MTMIPPPVDMRVAEAFIHGTKALYTFSNEKIVPILKSILTNDLHDKAMLETYFRMYLWMHSLVKLDHPGHYQTVLNAARGMYELLIDLYLLKADQTAGQKYHDFAFVNRFDAARKYVNALTANPTTPRPTKSPQPDRRLAFVGDPANQAMFDALRVTHWPDKAGKPTTPTHWSGVDLAARATKISVAELLRYRHVYASFCSFVHPGGSGTIGIDESGLHHAHNWAHGCLREYFLEATNLVCDVQKVYIANPKLKDELKTADEALGRYYQGIPDPTD